VAHYRAESNAHRHRHVFLWGILRRWTYTYYIALNRRMTDELEIIREEVVVAEFR
jgi:hypothetical protein